MKTPEQLADEHWAYVKSVMLQQLEVTGKMYREAMIHGYKHGKEDKDVACKNELDTLLKHN